MTALKTHAQERVFFSAHADLNLLPEKFRKQLRSAVPFLITNQDTTTNSYQITFTAESWKGVGSSAAWVGGNFIFEQKGTDEPTVREMSLPSIYDPALGKSRPMNVSLAAINVHGVFEGMGEAASQASTLTQGGGIAAAAAPSGLVSVPVVIPPFEIKSKDVVKGFDPPLTGDVHVDGDPATEDPKDDDLDPREWWTSVCQVPTPDAIRDLKVNDHLQVVFTNAGLAATYELLIDPDPEGDSADWITFTTISPMAQTNDLQITGKENPAGGIGKAKLILRQIGSTVPQAVIKVMVLPYRKLKLGVWDVYHSGRTGTNVSPHPDGAAIVSAAREAYAQACISFEGVPLPAGANPMTWWKIPASYDTNPANDTFNTKTEIQPLVGPSGALSKTAAEVNVVVVQAHDAAGAQAFTPYQGAPLSYAQAFDYDPLIADSPVAFLHSVTHEIGHQLNLSTRTVPVGFNGATLKNHENHDFGMFPSIIYQGKLVEIRGLMFSKREDAGSKYRSIYWLRHEDWERGSVTAEAKKVPWSYNPPPSQP